MKMLALVSSAIVIFPLLGMSMFFIRARASNGMKIERFAPIPSTPNCVSSKTNPEDPKYFPPLSMKQSKEVVVETIKRELAAIDGASLITVDESFSRGNSPSGDDSLDAYLHFEFRSQFFGFIDDVEFHVDSSAAIVHVRSASRTGQYDFQANRKRLEFIRDRLHDKI